MNLEEKLKLIDEIGKRIVNAVESNGRIKRRPGETDQDRDTRISYLAGYAAGAQAILNLLKITEEEK